MWTTRLGLVQCLLLLAFVCAAGCFPQRAGPRLAHFPELAPEVGESAPDFELRSLDGEKVRLSELIGDKPIVVQLGNYSCPVFRYRRGWVDDLVEDFGDRVHFLVVYTLEAHPVGSKSPHADEEWLTIFNRIADVRIPQHETYEERRRQASTSREKLGMSELVLVDQLDNTVWERFGAASSPAFVIDREGRVVLRQPWITPKEIRRALERLLAMEGTGVDWMEPEGPLSNR